MSFTFEGESFPDNYNCHNCGVKNIRLWREYGCFCPTNLCFACAEARGRRNHSDDPNWKSPFALGKGDQIGWFVPCVPVENTPGLYWGYGAVPAAGINWWYNLPLK